MVTQLRFVTLQHFKGLVGTHQSISSDKTEDQFTDCKGQRTGHIGTEDKNAQDFANPAQCPARPERSADAESTV